MAIISVASFANSKKAINSTNIVDKSINQLSIALQKSDNDKSLEQISLEAYLRVMQLSVQLSCGLTLSFQYTPAEGATILDILNDMSIMQAWGNNTFCPPPPPLIP